MSQRLKPTEPRRLFNRIARLPHAIRCEINRRLCDGWKLTTICEWLFEQKAVEDIPDLGLKAGDSYSLVWKRGSISSTRSVFNCKDGLLRWFRTGYRLWLADEAHRTETIQLVERVEKLTEEAAQKEQPESRTGGNVLIRSLLIDAISGVRSGKKKDPARIAQLAHAWSHLDRNATHNEKLKLTSRDAVNIGLEALKDQIKANPEALDLFNKLYDTLTASEKPTS